MKAIFAVLVAFALLFGCSGSAKAGAQAQANTQQQNQPEQPPPAPPSGEGGTAEEKAPSFSISSPANGATVEAGTVIVQVMAKDLVLGKPGTAAVKGEGHFHAYLDGGPYLLCSGYTCEVKGILAGQHTIEVELQNNDHTPYKGVARQSVRFTAVASAPAPTFQIESPAPNQIVSAGTVIVRVSAQNFVLGTVGGAPAAGEGHFHAYLDSGAYLLCTGLVCEVPGVLPGSHTIKVVMQQNDHTPYPGVEEQTVTFTSLTAGSY